MASFAEESGLTLSGTFHEGSPEDTWAELESQEADEADSLAVSHEDMAKAAAH